MTQMLYPILVTLVISQKSLEHFILTHRLMSGCTCLQLYNLHILILSVRKGHSSLVKAMYSQVGSLDSVFTETFMNH